MTANRTFFERCQRSHKTNNLRCLCRLVFVYIMARNSLIKVCFRVIYRHTERETHQNKTEVHTMNAKTARQIEKMKKQTIGVEVEMNSITREKAARVAADFFRSEERRVGKECM